MTKPECPMRTTGQRVFFTVLAVFFACLFVSPIDARQSEDDSPPTADDLGSVTELAFGVLYVPNRFDPEAAGGVDLLVHFHGGRDILARALDEHGINAVMIHISPGGLSSSYRVPFEDEDLFGELLDEALTHLRGRGDVADDAGWRRINLSSFSAGFGAVRELLRRPGEVERIDGIALCDTVYAGYVERDGENTPNPQQVAPFIAYARLAADEDGDKVLVVTHSYLEPGTYAGTHETAQAMIDALDAPDRAVEEDGPGDMRINRRATLGRFEVFGIEGDDGQAHMKHLHTAGHWVAMLEWDSGE